MVPKRLLVLLVALLVLVLVAAASATQQVGSGTATITGSGTNWSLTIANTGTEAIKCWRYTFPPGIQATGIETPPSGWQVGGNKPPPAPILGGRSDAGITPNAKATFGFTTTRAFDTGRRLASASADPPGTTAGSTDCLTDFTIPTDYGSSPPPPPPAPKPKTCKCRSLDVTSVAIDRGTADLRLHVNWELQCSKKKGSRCEGKLVVVAPSKKFKIAMQPKDGTVACKGRCKRTTTENYATVVLTFDRDDLGRAFWKGQSFYFKLKTFCKRGSTFVANGTQSATIAFDEDGDLDKVQSDLSANGKPDGDEKKK